MFSFFIPLIIIAHTTYNTEPFSFGGLYGTLSKFGNSDITGDGAMEFFSNRIKVTSKWSASYSTTDTSNKKQKTAAYEDKASFDGKM